VDNDSTSQAHTPGPWTITDDFISVWAKRNGITTEIARLDSSVNGLSPQESLADAYFMAAAPDLLAACQKICRLVFRDKSGVQRIELDQYQRAERACRAAIAMAQGRYPSP
jgi:hypothetical protein